MSRNPSAGPRRPASARRHSCARGHGDRLAGAVGTAVERLESRQLLSADVIDFGAIAAGTLTDTATDLGSVHVKSKASAKGSVGVTSTDVVYKLTVTEPLNLTLKLSKLKQQDELQLLFADGTPISAGWTNGKASSIKVSQRLDAGVYYVDVAHGFKGPGGVQPVGAAKVKKYKLKATDGFSLSVSGAKPDATVLPPTLPVAQTKFSSAFGGTGAVSQPAISADLAANSGYFHYSDFSGSPLWSADGPRPDDVIQGAVGDCYFLSVISSLARTNPGLIAQSIVPQANGNYSVRFQWNGQEYTEQVDAKLPTNTGGELVFARQPASGALWPALLEKAYCFFRPGSNDPGSYDGIDGGLPSESIKGFGSTDTQDVPATQFRTAPQLVEYVSTLLQHNQTIDLDTVQPRGWVNENALPGGLYSGHAYSVVSADVAANALTLRNPWATNTRGVRDDGSGGYITITGDQAMQSMAGLSFGSVAIVQTTIDPTPDPEPTPDPTITDGVPERLGDHSFLTDGGANYDVFTVVATTTGEATILVDTTAFVPQLLVAEVGFDGGLDVITTDDNTFGVDFAFVTFTAVAGRTYEFGVFAGGDADTGAYSLKLSNNLGSLTQLRPSADATAATGTIAGYVYEDENANGVDDGSEGGSPNWTVYVDADNDGTLDAGELSAVTDDNGDYAFDGLAPGTYTVRVVQEDGWTQTQPAGVNYGWTGTVDAGETAEFSPFGMVFASGSLSGIVYSDANANGFQDAFEPGLANYAVYIDVGNEGRFVTGDPYVYSGIHGEYSFTGLNAGTYTVRIYRYDGYTTTEGASGWAPVVVGGADVNGGSFGIVYTG